MDHFQQQSREWERQIFERQLHNQKEKAEKERFEKTMEKLSSTEKNYITKIEAVEQEMGKMAINILDLMNKNKKLNETVKVYENQFQAMNQKMEKFNDFMNEEKTRLEVNKALETENRKLNEKLVEMQEQMNRMEIDIKSKNDNWKSNLEWVQLHQKVVEFTKAIKEKEGKLPELGQNNSEDFEMQKFVNFVVYCAEKLEEATRQTVEDQTESSASIENENDILD